jgi:hypothetical protein
LTALLAVAATIWWLDVFIDARLVEVGPDWPARLEALLRDAGNLYSQQSHPLDIACPVELRPWQITVYRPGDGGYTEGGSGNGRPDVAVRSAVGPRTRLYVGPGPGWAVGSPNAMGWAWTWVGYWCPTAEPSCANGTQSSGVLIDPWGRGSRAWVVAHELGHAAGLPHREVFAASECSLMAYDNMLHVACPNNGERLTQGDCDAILSRARIWQTPGDGHVAWEAPPRPPLLSE